MALTVGSIGPEGRRCGNTICIRRVHINRWIHNMLGPLFGCVIKKMGECICAVEIGVQLGNLVLLFMVLVEFLR